MSLYRENILDHYKNPRNFGKIPGSSKSSHAENPSCGDSISMDVVIDKGKFEDIKFTGEGCSISIATASILTEELKGKPISTVIDYNLEKLEELLGIEIVPARKKCAKLPLNILKKIVLKELKNQSFPDLQMI